MDDQAILAGSLAGDREHSLHQNVQADIWAHLFSSLMDISGAFQEKIVTVV
jgi:hypothetical protein